MKGILIAVVALVVLAGGGAGAYYFLKPKDANAETAAAETKKDKPEGPVAYVEMDPFVLSVVDKTQTHQFVSIAVALEVSDPQKVSEVEQKMPKLTDAYLTEMYGTFAQKALAEGGSIPLDVVRQKLKRITNDVMGEGVVDDVLMQMLNQHPV